VTGPGRRFRRWAGELVVPGLMLALVGAYWWQAGTLSASALSFPLALTAVLVLLLVGQLALAARRRVDESASADAEAPRSAALVAQVRRVALVGLAAMLFLYWRELGGTLVIYLFTLRTLVLLGERHWRVLLALPLGMAVVLSFLFKSVLLVRFPDGLLALF
jgi:hypothetical protein